MQEIITESINHISGSLNNHELLSNVVTFIKQKLKWSNFMICLLNEELIFKIIIRSGLLKSKYSNNFIYSFVMKMIRNIIKESFPVIINDLSNNNYVKDKIISFKGSMLFLPMIYRKRIFGVIHLYENKVKAFNAEDIFLLHLLSVQVAAAKFNSDMYAEVSKLTYIDSLTGIMNKRALEKKIYFEIQKFQLYKIPFSILMLDIDHFKHFNDNMGHVLGDIVLKKIVKICKLSIRKIDSMARFGGEEFCIILPMTGESIAMNIANIICYKISKINIDGYDNQPLGFFSVSIGIAIYPDNITLDINSKLTDVLQAADRALYFAKINGRNRVELFSKCI